MTDRRQRLQDAAIRVLGARGLRQLTHRAVDEAAGLPEGSASNQYRTRDALLTAALDRVLEQETAAWDRLAADRPPTDVAGFVAVLGRLLRDLAGPQRGLVLARQALFMEAAVRPDLRPAIAAGRDRLAGWGVPLLAALGSADPQPDLRTLLALVEGLLFTQVAHPEPDFAPEAALAALLRGLLAPPPLPPA
ncbi:TetR family transcriptional regulator [Micromonospora rosaria]|uniref:TetR family transcriptional regulator n=1 Tax=Micromonospora rosaria TaxID=47874 RepID=A0A136PQ22_9ACTN|nr:TetR/AcrR family transcriptional regulator [Micromonospora rosaria]KXK60437.1 TetR family transcriptional regulator [Micromonospora rosaria]